jgi:hypothetical protein
VLTKNPRFANGARTMLARTKSTSTTAWEICLAPVQFQFLVRCGRASQFSPATDKIYKYQINKPIGCQADEVIPADADTNR